MKRRKPKEPPAVAEPGRLGKRGIFVIPAKLRRALGLAEGSMLLAELRDEGILLRPAEVIPRVEVYAPERRAELLLNNAIDAEDYAWVRRHVRKTLGIDPDAVPHLTPEGERRGPPLP